MFSWQLLETLSFPRGLLACLTLQFLWHHTPGVHLPIGYNRCGTWATGTYGRVRKCYRGHSRGLVDSTLCTSWPCAAEVCPWEPLPEHSGNTTSPTMRPTAVWTAQRMSGQRDDTMALILPQEQKDLEGSQQRQEEEAANEVDSPSPSPRTAAAMAAASRRGRTEGSQEPTPSTSTAEVLAAPSADPSSAVIPKLKHKNVICLGKAAKSTSPHRCPWMLRQRSLPLRVWKTHHPLWKPLIPPRIPKSSSHWTASQRPQKNCRNNGHCEYFSKWGSLLSRQYL